MVSYKISRLNPKSGLMEQPYRDKDGQFILADPAGGAQRHHAKFAIKVSTTAEAVAYLSKGFPIRMTDGQSAPSLVSTRSVTITPIDMEGDNESSLGSATARNPPPAKEAVMDELKRLLCIQADQIALVGSEKAAASFIGFPSRHGDSYADGDWTKVDLHHFESSDLLSQAYDYAYQTGEYWKYDLAEDVQDFRQWVQRFTLVWKDSKDRPDDEHCWRTTETAYARWKLELGTKLSIRELSFLANITESATRTSLSREGLSAADGNLSNEDAFKWLEGRRGFIPTKSGAVAKKDKTLFWSDAAFQKFGLAEALKRLIRDWKQTTPEQIQGAAGVSPCFMDALMQGRPVLDLEALQRVGAALEIDVPQFVGLAVKEELRAKQGEGSDPAIQ